MAVAEVTYRRIEVPDPLRGVVEHVWVLHQPAGRGETEVLLPDGRGLVLLTAGAAGLLVDPLTGERRPEEPELRGPWTHALVRTQTGPGVRLGLQLHPLGPARLRGGRPIADRALPLADVVGPVADDASRLLAAGAEDDAARLLLDALARQPIERSADLDRLDDVVARVDQERGLVRPVDLARFAGVQLAELHRWCVALLGMAPAAYLSAVRFSSYVRERVGAGPVRLEAAVAALRWFMDPAYPAREVERFTGLAPADLRRLVERLRRPTP
ncbi:MAG: hypothetical protein BGO38_11980 [Cellulomonas sp. 73-145]|uniref:hypothetical protein n=1 Tax=Cellulomonas sp. 73-145 TaxID=1895739 RepID=UPI00092ABB11|nr:hypothetical protein [Cellulomonas sp. 73-145]OJV59542.1 MAG: hypothetical protein BGO38_11980 [Cellulomonas sp. 73-145]